MQRSLSRKTPDASLLAPSCHCNALCCGTLRSQRFGQLHSASSLHRTCRKPRCRSRGQSGDVRRRSAGYDRGRDGSDLSSVVREDQRAIPIADRTRDSDHASNVGRSAHRRRHDMRNNAVSASNTLISPAQSPALAGAGALQCDLNHISRFEPVLSSQHQNVMHANLQGVNSED